MRRSLRKRNNIVIGALCAVLLFMVAGYAAFSTKLNISSGASVTSAWDIEITNIRGANPEGGDAYDITPPTYTKTSANFNTGLITPNTIRYYEVEISNSGNLAGYVSIGNLSCGDNEAIGCWVSETNTQLLNESGEIVSDPDENYLDIREGSNDYSSVGFSIEPGQKHYLYIAVMYKDVTSQPENLNANVNLELAYQQGDITTYTITYKDYDTDKVLEEVLCHTAGDSCDVILPKFYCGCSYFLKNEAGEFVPSDKIHGEHYTVTSDTVLYARLWGC